MCEIDKTWKSGDTVKKEIDLIINNIAIELKYPAKKAPANESYWHFLEDIIFLQQLIKNDYTITKGYFIVLLDQEKRNFYLPTSEKASEKYKDVYSYFRECITIKSDTEIECPIKRKQGKLKIHYDTKITWYDIRDEYKYILLEIK